MFMQSLVSNWIELDFYHTITQKGFIFPNIFGKAEQKY